MIKRGTSYMAKVRKIQLFLVLSLILVFVSMFFSFSMVAGESGPFLEVEEKLMGVFYQNK